jgi:ribokinase
MSVLVFGSINSDGVVKVPRLPHSGETIRATDFETYPGGKGANQAVASARIGAPTSLVGRVGRDGIGAYLIEELRSSGVDVGGVGGDMEATTGLALITVAADGSHTIVTVGGANHRVGSEELHAFELLISTASIVLVQLEIPIDAVTTAVDIANTESVDVMLDPAPVRELPDDLYGKLAWITPNEHEARALTGSDEPERAAAILHERGVPDVVVTLGARGPTISAPREEPMSRRRGSRRSTRSPAAMPSTGRSPLASTPANLWPTRFVGPVRGARSPRHARAPSRRWRRPTR